MNDRVVSIVVLACRLGTTIVDTLTKLVWFVVIYNKKGVWKEGKGKALFSLQNKGCSCRN